jgi:hypothetical protein
MVTTAMHPAADSDLLPDLGFVNFSAIVAAHRHFRAYVAEKEAESYGLPRQYTTAHTAAIRVFISLMARFAALYFGRKTPGLRPLRGQFQGQFGGAFL